LTRIILVRHGETDWNVRERFRGRFDIPLNANGKLQAARAARYIAFRWKPAAIYSSPLSRAVKTAEPIADVTSLRVGVLPSLIDMSFGEWEGLSPEEIGARWPDQLATWYSAPHTIRIPGGETLEEVRQRCRETLITMTSRHPDETVVAVAHTDVNRTMLLVVLGLENSRLRSLRQDNCAINEIEAEGGRFTLASMNETGPIRDFSLQQQ
jgi:broad specificity phosphatase PhoE